MEQTSKPAIAGILIIISGVLGLIAGLGSFIGFGVVSGNFGVPTGYIPPFVPGLVMVTAIILTIMSIVTIVGGVYSLKRKIWGLALAGAIMSIFVAFPLGLALGIAAIVLLIMSANEFA
jgi:hypothetical protein